MALTQVQIIRSLGEALAWFEKELAWGVSPGELGHLTGRIGELYAAMITRGQMALATNQHGYDVVSLDGDHISVKTVTTSSHVAFRKSTFLHVDRVLVLRINVTDGEAAIEELLDRRATEIADFAIEGGAEFTYRIGSGNGARRARANLDKLVIVSEVSIGDRRIVQYENGTIAVEQNGDPLLQAKPTLREIATSVVVPIVNGNGNALNTRQLGSAILAALNPRESVETALGALGDPNEDI